MKLYPLLALIFFSTSSFAYKNDLALKAGLTLVRPYVTSNYATHEELETVGFNTHFGYKWDYLSLDLSSYFYWGGFDHLKFVARGETIEGEGNFRNVSFSPILRYHFTNYEPIKGWNIFAGAGPAWSLESVSFRSFSSSGPLFNIDHKITYETFGGFLVLGIEQNLELKDDHPLYIELSAGYKKSRHISVVDKGNFTNTDIISEEEKIGDLRERVIALSFGILLF